MTEATRVLWGCLEGGAGEAGVRLDHRGRAKWPVRLVPARMEEERGTGDASAGGCPQRVGFLDGRMAEGERDS